MIKKFSPEQISVIAPLEHARWVREHLNMGWTVGDDYEELAQNTEEVKQLRELFRQHKLLMPNDVTDEEIYQHYLSLSEEDRNKDYEPFNSMLKLIKKFDGLRIYALD